MALSTDSPFAFTRDPDGSWYAVIPSYPGPRGDLQMVCGADTLLDIMSEGASALHIIFTAERREGWPYLKLSHLGNQLEEGGGITS